MILQQVLPNFIFAISFCFDNIYVCFQYLFMHVVCANIFVAIVLKPRFKIDVVIMIMCSIIGAIDRLYYMSSPNVVCVHVQVECSIR